MRILVIEDDEVIAHTLLAILTNQNYAVEVAANGQSGWELIEAFNYDLILLDVMLPQIDGITLCRQIRAKGLQMPILLLTAQDSSHRKAIGLDAGADDYVVKPFDEEELVARVRALLRRGGAIAHPVLSWGDLQLDPSSCEVTYGPTPLLLTPKEYALLELFLRNSRRVFSCGMILEHLWSYGEMPGEEAVRTHIKGLRQKLKAVGVSGDAIETVYGIGYRLKPRDTAPPPEAAVPKRAKAKQRKTLAGREAVAPASAPVGVGERDDSAAIAKVGKPKSLPASVSWIWHRFKDRVNQQVGVLERAAIALDQGILDAELQQQARQEAHTLAGSLGTFGLPQGSQVARQMEQFLQTKPPFHAEEIAQYQAWVRGLRQAIAASYEDSSPAPPAEPDQGHEPLLLVMERGLADPLVRQAADWKLSTRWASSLVEAKEQIGCAAPDVVLFDPAIASTLTDSLLFLSELNHQVPPIPVILLTDQRPELLETARLGGGMVLQRATPPLQVLEVVQQVVQQANRAKAKVLIVDDDPQLLELVRSLLEPWGLKITTLNHPQQFWGVLETTTPDLVILDIEMPQMSGIELCQIIRNDTRWAGLPILFLTAHTDPETVNQVFSVGADDFVSKPIIGPELVTRIINRLERIRFLRNFTELDPLTQLSTRQKSTQDLERLIHLAKRQRQPFCLAVLDLTHFKQINDRYSHATGDEVLYQIGQLLRRSFRVEDVVARWGGEEFVIGLYGMTREDGKQRLTRVLETLYQTTFTASTAMPLVRSPLEQPVPPAFQVTFQAGVAQYPDDGIDVFHLYRAADAALTEAKQCGQVPVVVAHSSPPCADHE